MRHWSFNLLHARLLDLAQGDPHTQYAYLAGRAGGQTLVGGTAASEHLILDPTSNSTKGQVRFNSNGRPVTSNTHSWGTNLGRWTYGYFNAGIQISANNYFAQVADGTQNGIFFDASTPRNISFDISGSKIHTLYMGASADEGAFFHLPRTSAPTNATTNGTMYVADDGAGNMTLKIRSGGAWVNV